MQVEYVSTVSAAGLGTKFVPSHLCKEQVQQWDFIIYFASHLNKDCCNDLLSVHMSIHRNICVTYVFLLVEQEVHYSMFIYMMLLHVCLFAWLDFIFSSHSKVFGQ